MKFKQYILNEGSGAVRGLDVTEEEMIEVLRKRCKPFLQERDKNLFLFRGTRKFRNSENPMQIVKPRTNRKPKDTDPEIHEMLDEKFKEKFGWYARSEGVFCHTELMEARKYVGFNADNVYLFFPVGRYKYVYNPYIEDIYNELPESAFDYSYVDDLVNSLMRNYKETGLSELTQGDSVEMMFKCNYYYMIHYPTYYNYLMRSL